MTQRREFCDLFLPHFSGRLVLVRAGRNFALTGGYCRRGVEIDLDRAVWLFQAKDDSTTGRRDR